MQGVAHRGVCRKKAFLCANSVVLGVSVVELLRKRSPQRHRDRTENHRDEFSDRLRSRLTSTANARALSFMEVIPTRLTHRNGLRLAVHVFSLCSRRFQDRNVNLTILRLG